MAKKIVKGSHLDQRTPLKKGSPVAGKSKGLNAALSKAVSAPKNIKAVKIKFK